MKRVIRIVLGVMLGWAAAAIAGPVELRHVADVSVSTKAVLQWIDCTPQRCVMPVDLNDWVPYQVVGVYVDAGIDRDWRTDTSRLLFLGQPGHNVMQPLDADNLANLPSVSEGDVPSDENYVSLTINGRSYPIALSANGRLLLADNRYFRIWGGNKVAAHDYPETPEDECRQELEERAEYWPDHGDICPGDNYPIPADHLTPDDRLLEFTLWEAWVAPD